MTPEILEQISTLVRAAFYPKGILTEILCEEMYEPGELDPCEVSQAIDAKIQKVLAEQASWPALTDCDRLDIVFKGNWKRLASSWNGMAHSISES